MRHHQDAVRLTLASVRPAVHEVPRASYFEPPCRDNGTVATVWLVVRVVDVAKAPAAVCADCSGVVHQPAGPAGRRRTIVSRSGISAPQPSHLSGPRPRPKRQRSPRSNDGPVPMIPTVINKPDELRLVRVQLNSLAFSRSSGPLTPGAESFYRWLCEREKEILQQRNLPRLALLRACELGSRDLRS
jgi:hypothetical protein